MKQTFKNLCNLTTVCKLHGFKIINEAQKNFSPLSFNGKQILSSIIIGKIKLPFFLSLENITKALS
jgi:hypothetical protein